MSGFERREGIVSLIKKSDKAIPAKDLADIFSVSRQVIVQDIALIRASGYDIISTNRGYLLNQPVTVSCVLKMNHTDEQIEDELNTIVDLGGTAVDVSVRHKIYGPMEAPLLINSRRKVQEFMSVLNSGKSSPLKNITSGYHYHKIEAESEEMLKEIEDALKEKGYLVEKEV